jgi:hypothetical protein
VEGGRSGAPIDIGRIGGCSGGPGLTVGGDLRVTTNGARVMVGGNAVKGELVIVNNTARLTIRANTARDIDVHGNTVGVGSVLTGNAAAGNCRLEHNKPKITGTANRAKKHHANTCNRIA